MTCARSQSRRTFCTCSPDHHGVSSSSNRVTNRLDRDDAHETVFIPQSLVDEASKPPRAVVLLGAQLRPGIAQHRFWITEREQRLSPVRPPSDRRGRR